MNKHYPLPIPSEGSLHRPEREGDACGVGFVADVKGRKSHKVLQQGITSVCNVVHRGAMDADLKTGDGCGVLTQIPHKLFRQELKSLFEFDLPRDTDLGVGMFFLPQNEEAKMKIKLTAEIILDDLDIKVLGWRKVPLNERELGQKARDTRPSICQLFVLRDESMSDDEFERTLYIARRRIGVRVEKEGVKGFYIPSFSHRTIVYKALALPTALAKFYDDLRNPLFETAICLYHQRFSTNTFPTWNLCHPFRMLAHNGEINTLRGNRNWLTSRESDFESDVWGERVKYLRPMVDLSDSDSATLDIALELLVMSGRSVEEAMSLLVPPAYRIDPFTTPALSAYYQYNRCFAEPWDGPASLVFTDGHTVAACLDRNGLRPSRFKITTDGLFTIGSEVGVIEIDDSRVERKGRLAPGEMLSINTLTGEVKFNAQIRTELAARKPYAEWLKNRFELSKVVDPTPRKPEADLDILTLSQKQASFGYTKEELDMVFAPMIKDGQEAIYSMGDDTPLAVLSLQPRLLFTYFKQLFAQVTNPPIDPIRERLVMSLAVSLGWYRNFLRETPEHARVVALETPFLWQHELEALQNLPDYPARIIQTTWPLSEGEAGLEKAVGRVCYEAEAAVNDGVRILILSDRQADHENVAIPSLLVTAAVHHYLNRARKRMRLSLVVDSGEARDVHHMACLFGYGAQAVCPYLAYDTIRELIEGGNKDVTGTDFVKAMKNYRYSLEKGVLKIMSKMGISVLSSYQGAQIFEAVGISSDLIRQAFTGTPSQIEGIGMREIAMESLARHKAGYGDAIPKAPEDLGDPGYYRFRQKGEKHAVDAGFIKNFHTFVKTGKAEDYEAYVKEYTKNRPISLHDLFEMVPQTPIDISEVEPIEDIRVRFTTAAMSLGALSPEAHEALAIAMNEIGGKSNSGEGGEDPVRYKRYENGDWANSKIKQIASGRFGVTAEYLASAEELEIKMAQGAKPGEGGQLPGAKVQGIIARLRRTSPGVQLISPPPHHDIYSIEDLAQLIHDLKEVNPRARVCVKLVAESGVGTIAAGVAKANADIILVSGHEGGTGASPISSIKHAGLPWEIGLAETQQVLMMNGLRDRVTLRTDGGLRNGLDIIHAAILGAEEYNFGTIALIALGCVYVRKCHLNTCPVGIATQDPKYREKFKGKKEYVINFFNSVAEEVRQHMAALGVRKLNDLIGRVEFLKQREVPGHPKANMIKLDRILKNVARDLGEDVPRICVKGRNERISFLPHPLDDKLIQQSKDAINDDRPVVLHAKVKNTDRNIGTKLSGEIAYHLGDLGLKEGLITVNCEGSAGQSFGTFLCSGIKLVLTGEANDYVGKGMTAGEIIIKPRPIVKFDPSENSIMGNTCLYGATGGYLFANGRAGERFGVRNSGATAVIEGCGDHGCEYMTNGCIVILGPTGKNFAAGMSGGIAFVYDEQGNFEKLHNDEFTGRGTLTDPEDENRLKALIYRHLESTDSPKARALLADWDTARTKFVLVRPSAPPPAPVAPAPAVSAAPEPPAAAAEQTKV